MGIVGAKLCNILKDDPMDLVDLLTTELVCENCGSTDNVSEGLDPYMIEIEEEEVEVCWCEACYEERAMDI